MNPDLFQAVQTNLLSPAVLFFLLGVIATLLKSDLKFPESLYITLTIYLLLAIGFKGGVAIHSAGLGKVWLPALASMAMGALIPLWVYPVLRYLGGFPAVDAAAVGAHYGSVSAVTYIAAVNYLKESSIAHEDYAAAFLAVMEAPAILVGVLLAKVGGTSGGDRKLGTVIHEAVVGRSILLLVGGLFAGWASGPKGAEVTAGFFIDPFQGVLALFLLEMGMVAARRFQDLKKVGAFLIAFGIVAPLINGTLGCWLGSLVGLSLGGCMLLGVLAASASYIAAPAAIRLSLPEANPTLYLTSALAITFPFNITLGLPIYLEIALYLGGAQP